MIREKIAILESLPEIGSPVEDDPIAGLGYRELIVKNYRVLYRYRDEGCQVVAILRAEQDLARAFSDINIL